MVDLPQPSPWAPLTVVAAYTRRNERTIRTWARRLQVPSCCDLQTREILVARADVIDRPLTCLARLNSLTSPAALTSTDIAHTLADRTSAAKRFLETAGIGRGVVRPWRVLRRAQDVQWFDSAERFPTSCSPSPTPHWPLRTGE